MGSGDHNPGICSHRGGDKGNTGCGHGSDQKDIHPHGTDTGSQGIFNHITGNPRILADDNPVPSGLILDGKSDCPADLHRYFYGHWINIGDTTDTVCSK